MHWPTECAVVIPCLNEAAAITDVVLGARRSLPQVIVVDDGSSDETSALAARAGAEVIRHERPHGKGFALNIGWQRAAQRGFSWALAMDGDGQHAPEDMPQFLAAAGQGNAVFIVGNRFTGGGQMPWLRRHVNHWMSRRLSVASGVDLPDSQCGFRLMRLDVWSRLSIEACHFEIESEILLAFIATGRSIRFVPVQTIYKDERSKIHPVRDTLRWFAWQRRARAILARRGPVECRLKPAAGT